VTLRGLTGAVSGVAKGPSLAREVHYPCIEERRQFRRHLSILGLVKICFRGLPCYALSTHLGGVSRIIL